GMNLPPNSLEYYPRTDKMRDLGRVFSIGRTVYRLSVGPKDDIALRASGSTEVALYDPATGQFTQYGQIGRANHNYVYYLYNDKDFIYAVARGKDPWDVVVIHKATGRKKAIT